MSQFCFCVCCGTDFCIGGLSMELIIWDMEEGNKKPKEGALTSDVFGQ